MNTVIHLILMFTVCLGSLEFPLLWTAVQVVLWFRITLVAIVWTVVQLQDWVPTLDEEDLSRHNINYMERLVLFYGIGLLALCFWHEAYMLGVLSFVASLVFLDVRDTALQRTLKQYEDSK